MFCLGDRLIYNLRDSENKLIVKIALAIKVPFFGTVFLVT